MPFQNGEKNGFRLGLRGIFPIFFLVCFGILSSLPDLRPAVPEMLGITALILIGLAGQWYLEETGRISPWPPVTILVLAAVFRLLFVFHPPQLSDDLYRYALDGHQVAAGRSPYALSPAQAAQRHPELAALAACVNHPRLVTLYPPAAQLLFAAGVAIGGVLGLKLMLVVLDLLFIGTMMRLMSKTGLSPSRVILYAWHPLSILEIAGSGHVDGACLFFVFLAFCLIPAANTKYHRPVSSGRQHVSEGPFRKNGPSAFWAGVLFAVAILIKLYPVVLLPLSRYLIPRGKGAGFTFGLSAGSVLLILPFCPDIRNSLPTLTTYIRHWEFSGLLFCFLRHLTQTGTIARIILGLVFAALLLYAYRLPGRARNKPGPGSGMISEVFCACYIIGFGLLAVTPTLHPWYGLYLLAFLPFSPSPAGLVLSWTILLGYQVLIPFHLLGRWVETPWVPIMIWLGPAMGIGLPWGYKRFIDSGPSPPATIRKVSARRETGA